MQYDTVLNTFLAGTELYKIMGFILAFVVTFISIPPIVRVAREKKLYARQNGRTSHKKQVPVLGGLAIFAGLILSTILFTAIQGEYELKFIIAGLMILFFLGMKDDIFILDPKKKLIGQLIAIGLVVIPGDIRITSFQGFLGIYEMGAFSSILFSVFVFIVITNSFNLIDGIDGLASGVGILVSVVFGSWFSMAGFVNYCVISFSLTGALVAFFLYNVFGTKNKIFLGDTGSLILGFIVAVITIRFLELSMTADAANRIDSAPVVAFGVLIIPLFDTLRVFTIRIFKGSSPFKADRKHMHHILLGLGYSHLQATGILLTVNVFFIFLVYKLQEIGDIPLLVLIISLATVLSIIPFLFLGPKKIVKKAHEADAEKKQID